MLSSDGVHVEGVLVLPAKTNTFPYEVPFVTEKDSSRLLEKNVAGFLKTNESRIIRL